MAMFKNGDYVNFNGVLNERDSDFISVATINGVEETIKVNFDERFVIADSRTMPILSNTLWCDETVYPILPINQPNAKKFYVKESDLTLAEADDIDEGIEPILIGIFCF